MSGWETSETYAVTIYSILVIVSRMDAGVITEELSFRSYEDAEVAYNGLVNNTYKLPHAVDIVRLYKHPGNEAVAGSVE